MCIAGDDQTGKGQGKMNATGGHENDDNDVSSQQQVPISCKLVWELILHVTCTCCFRFCLKP
jgi:hypothetical protein